MTLPVFLDIVRRFRKSASVCVFRRRERKGSPVWHEEAGAESHGQAQLTGQTGPRNRSFLAKGRVHRYGVRAFSTLEGYADRNRETELAFLEYCGKTPGHRPGFRLRLERGQTRSSNLWAFCALTVRMPLRSEDSPKGPARG